MEQVLPINRLSLNNYLFFGLTINLIVCFVLTSFVEPNGIMARILSLLLISSIVFSSLAISKRKIHTFLALLFCMIILPSTISPASVSESFSLFQLIVLSLYFSYVFIMIFYKIYSTKKVDLNTLLGSVCAYFILGVIWGLVYILIEVLSTGSFKFADQSGIRDLIYYSFVSLTTLGFGDITPISSPAKALTAMEAFIGQIYLAVVIARLIALQMREGHKA